MDVTQALTFHNRDAWRSWLKENHDTFKEVWLVHYKKSSQVNGLGHLQAVEEALCFGWIDSTLKKIDSERFVLKYSPRKSKSVWSKINKEKAEELIAAGKMTQAGLEKIKEAKKHGLWKKAYTNKTKERMPSDLKEALQAKEPSWENFQNFANSYRNMYIGWVKNARTPETRNRRIGEVVKRSAQKKKPGID